LKFMPFCLNLSLCRFLCNRVQVYVCVCVCACPSFSLLLSLFLCVCLCASVCTDVRLFCLSVCPSVRPFICRSVCMRPESVSVCKCPYVKMYMTDTGNKCVCILLSKSFRPQRMTTFIFSCPAYDVHFLSRSISLSPTHSITHTHT